MINKFQDLDNNNFTLEVDKIPIYLVVDKHPKGFKERISKTTSCVFIRAQGFAN